MGNKINTFTPCYKFRKAPKRRFKDNNVKPFAGNILVSKWHIGMEVNKQYMENSLHKPGSLRPGFLNIVYNQFESTDQKPVVIQWFYTGL